MNPYAIGYWIDQAHRGQQRKATMTKLELQDILRQVCRDANVDARRVGFDVQPKTGDVKVGIVDGVSDECHTVCRLLSDQLPLCMSCYSSPVNALDAFEPVWTGTQEYARGLLYLDGEPIAEVKGVAEDGGVVCGAVTPPGVAIDTLYATDCGSLTAQVNGSVDAEVDNSKTVTIYRLTCGATTPETARKVAETLDMIGARARCLAADEAAEAAAREAEHMREYINNAIRGAMQKWYTAGWYTGDVNAKICDCNSDTCHGCDDCGPAHEPKGEPVYGGVCRHCGSRDDYPEQGKDGKVCCWQCVGKHGGE